MPVSTAEAREPVPTVPGAPAAFHLLAKPTGAVCNLDCSYCFFLSKEMLYPGSRFRMADELLEEYVRQLIEAHASVPEVAIAWQGGEPTMMGVEFFRRSIELAERYLQAGSAGGLHDPDQRDAAGRGVGGVLRGARLPGRDLDRRAAGDARRLPRQQGRPGVVRPGHARARLPAARPGWSGTRSRPCTPATATTVARCTGSCATSAAPASSSSSRSSSASPRPPTARCRGRRGATGRCTSRRASWSRTARSAASSTAAS